MGIFRGGLTGSNPPEINSLLLKSLNIYKKNPLIKFNLFMAMSLAFADNHKKSVYNKQ